VRRRAKVVIRPNFRKAHDFGEVIDETIADVVDALYWVVRLSFYITLSAVLWLLLTVERFCVAL
jgi:hypothetical protein